MSRMKIKDIAVQKNERVDNPSHSPYSIFVGLEHYDSGEATIRRFGSTERLESAMKVFHAGDMLVARRNVYLKRAATVSFDGLTSGDSIVLHIADEEIRRIIPFVLNSDDFWNYANRHADGSMSKRLSPKLLMEYEFSIPDDNLHQAAEILWAMERVKNAYRELIARTDDLVKSQFCERFILGDRYPLVRLDMVSDVSSGLTKNPKRPTFENKMPYLRVANVFFDCIDLTDIQTIGIQQGEIEKTMLKKGDVLFVEGNGSPDQIGRVAVWEGQSEPMLHQNHIIKARPDKSKVLSKYCMYYFMTQEGRNQILSNAKTTSGLFTLSLSKISGFVFPLAPLEEQQQFLRIVNKSDKSKFVASNRNFSRCLGIWPKILTDGK